MKKFLRKIQNSEDSVKVRWLIFLSAASMAIVVFVWAKYFDNAVNVENPVETKDNSFSFVSSTKNGLIFIKDFIAGKIKNLAEIIGFSGNYTIEPQR